MKGKLLLALKILVSLSLLLWLLITMDLGRFRSIMLEMTPSWLLLAFVFKSCGVFASILRWKLLLRGQGMNIPLRFLTASFLEGRFFGSFFPSTIGLDTYRTYDLVKFSRQTASSISVTLVDKVIGLFSLSFLVLITSGAGAQMVGTEGVGFILAIFLFPMLISIAALMFPNLLGKITDAKRWKNNRWTKSIGRFIETLTVYSNQRGLLFQAMGLGIVIHLGTTLMYYGTALTVGANIDLSDILFTGPLMITATVIPLSIAGIGVREGAFIFFLSRIGVTLESATLLGFLGFLVGGFISLLGGVIFVLRSHRYKDKKLGPCEKGTRTETPHPGDQIGTEIIAEQKE